MSRYLTLAIILLWSVSSEAQWVPASGPNMQNVTAFAENGSTLFCGTATGDVFRSSDRGATWIDTHTGLTPHPINAIATYGSDLFIATQDTGVFRSSDNGTTWTAIDSGLTSPFVTSLALIDSQLFASTLDSGVFAFSGDNRIGWSLVDGGMRNKYYISSLAVVGKDLFTCISDTIYKLPHSSSRWKAISTVPYQGVLQSDGSALIVTGDYFYFYSTDNGITWQSLDPPSEYGGMRYCGGTLSQIYVIDMGVGPDILLSTDTGKSWRTVTNPTVNYPAMCVVEGSSVLANFWGDGLYRTNDTGVTWTRLGTSLPISASAIYSVGHTVFAGTTESGVFVTTDQGATWAALNTGLLRRNITSFTCDDDYLFAGTDSGIFRCGIHDSTWTNVSFKAVEQDIMQMCASGKTIACTANSGNGSFDQRGAVFTTTDDGLHWARHNLLNHTPYLYAIDAFDSVILVPAESYDPNDNHKYLFRSTNVGATWQEITLPWLEYQDYSEIQCFAHNDRNIYAGYNYLGVIASSDEGLTWHDTWSNPDDTTSFNFVNAIICEGPNVFVSANPFRNSDGSAFLSSDTPYLWRSVSDNLNGGIAGFAISDGVLFSLTNAEGIWRRPISEMLPTAGIANRPITSQTDVVAYPNPSSGSVTIAYDLKRRATVTIDLLDAAGHLVASPVTQQTQDAGAHSVSFGTSHLAQGVYWCRVRDGAQEQMVKVVIG